MKDRTLILLFIQIGVISLSTSQVIELGDSFEEKRGDKAWLVEFYAPWCGHCRSLEPEYHRVYMELKHTDIRVAKVDATRYSSIAHTYDVRGYPTIKFIEGDRVFTHQGDRSKDGIIEFAKRAKGPAVRDLPNIGRFNDARSDHASQVFFVYVGELNTSDQLLEEYTHIADTHTVYSYFYRAQRRAIPEVIEFERQPSVLCFKDSQVYEYEPNQDQTLEGWFQSERYTLFPKVSGGGINEMADVNKKLVIVLLDDDKQRQTQYNRYKETVRLFAQQYRDKYHKLFQFLWMSETGVMEQVTMLDLQAPSLVVLDPQSQQFYLPPSTADDISTNEIAAFLDSIEEGEIEALGGTGFFQRIKRLVYDIQSLVVGLFKESVWLACVVFGVPTCVVSLLCYGLCCMEPFDDEEPENQDEQLDKIEGTDSESETGAGDDHIKQD